jgi:hypothetical protein
MTKVQLGDIGMVVAIPKLEVTPCRRVFSGLGF